MNFKHLKATLHSKTKWIVAIKNWIHQGFFYLDKTEKFYRIIWEIISFFIIYGITQYFLSDWISIIISLFIAHTLNWIFNDNFCTAIMFTFPKVLNPGEQKTIQYLQDMQIRLKKTKSISGGMIYGSLSRNKWHIKSDLDMRLLRKPGIMNGFKGYLFVFRERLIALKSKQPLDVYMADNIQFLKKMRSDEHPLFLKNRDNRLIEEYKTSEESDFSKVKHLNAIR